MTSEIGRSKRVSKRRSRLVRMPTSLPSLVTGHAGDAVARHQRLRVGDRLVGTDGDRVHDHAALAAFDAVHLFRLPVDRHVAMDDADAALLRQRDRQVRFRHRIHGGGDDRNIQSDLAGEAGSGIDFGGEYFAAGRFEKNIIESQALGEYVLNHR